MKWPTGEKESQLHRGACVFVSVGIRRALLSAAILIGLMNTCVLAGATDYDCGDFEDRSEMAGEIAWQNAYAGDKFDLDGDGDGIFCEELPQGNALYELLESDEDSESLIPGLPAQSPTEGDFPSPADLLAIEVALEAANQNAAEEGGLLSTSDVGVANPPPIQVEANRNGFGISWNWVFAGIIVVMTGRYLLNLSEAKKSEAEN